MCAEINNRLMREGRFDVLHQNRSVRETLALVGFSDLVTVAAQGAVRVGGRRVLDFYGANNERLQTVLKTEAGMTPVTAADLASGGIMKRILFEKLFPNDMVNEEESGVFDGKEGSTRRWYIDPLDGTSSFAREQRYSTVGMAVYDGNKPKASTICQPFEKELLVAEVDKGSFSFMLDENLSIISDGKKLEVSKKPSLEGGIIYLDALFNNKTTPHKLKLIEELVALAKGKLGLRMSGSNIDQQRQVASGRAELTITDAVGGFFDLAAGSLIIKEAGGQFVGIDGLDVTEKTQVALGGNPELVRQVLPILQKCYSDYQGFK